MKSILLIAVCLLMTACTSNVKSMIILPTDSMLQECQVSPPPTLTGNPEKDKLLLASAWSLQTGNLGKCNQKLRTLKTWKINTAKRMEAL